MNKNRQQLGLDMAFDADIPLGGDYHASITCAQAFTLTEIARKVGYRRPKNANGSTARYFYNYLSR